MASESDKRLSLLKEELEKINKSIEALEIAQCYHGCDSYEDVFESELRRLSDIKSAIEVAIESLEDKE